MGEVPEIEYTDEVNEDLKRRRSEAGHSCPKGGDVKEGLAHRTRMAGQFENPDFEDF